MHAAIRRASIMIPSLPTPLEMAALYRLEKLPQPTQPTQPTPPEPPASRAPRGDSPDSLSVLQAQTPGRPRVNVDADSKRSFTNDRRPETPVSTFAQSFNSDYLALRAGGKVRGVDWDDLVRMLKKEHSVDELLFVKQCDAILELTDPAEFLVAVDDLTADYLTPAESKAGETSFLCERVNLGHAEKSKLEQCREACRASTSAKLVDEVRDAVVDAANNVWSTLGDKLKGTNGQ